MKRLIVLNDLFFSLSSASVCSLVVVESTKPTGSVGRLFSLLAYRTSNALGSSEIVGFRFLFLFLVMFFAVLFYLSVQVFGPGKKSRLMGWIPGLVAILGPMVCWEVLHNWDLRFVELAAAVLTAAFLINLALFLKGHFKRRWWGIPVLLVWLLWWGWLFGLHCDPVMLTVVIFGFLSWVLASGFRLSSLPAQG